MSQCCLTGFKWQGKPVGKETKLTGNNAYVTGSNKEVAIMIVHEIFGWTLTNERLIADHYAREANATVYLPDFYDGEVVAQETMDDPEQFKNFDMAAFFGRHSKEIRWPEILGCATALKQEYGFKKLGVIGFCYGGWAVFQLGAKGQNLVECISTAHPSMLTEEEINAVGVPTQVLACEHDLGFSPELKLYCNTKIPTLGVDYDYQFFPGLSHGWAVRGDPNNPLQRKGLERAKNAAVGWFNQMLHSH